MSDPTTLRVSRRFAAFTLLELLAVIGVIALLTGLVIGAGRRASDTAKAVRARAELGALVAGLESYKAIHGDYPRTEDPAKLLQSLIGRRGPADQLATIRPLIEAARFSVRFGLDPFSNETAVLLDPWEQPYRYAYKSQSPWANPSYVLYSAGPDQGDSTPLSTGGFPNRTAATNADNIHADRP